MKFLAPFPNDIFNFQWLVSVVGDLVSCTVAGLHQQKLKRNLMKRGIIQFLCVNQFIRVINGCNLTAYKIWSDADYIGTLRSDPDFWRYQKQKKFTISNILALELAYGKCKALFDSLIDWKAGRAGPIDDQTTWDVMCSKFCLENDLLHQIAMRESECSCIQLSTQFGEPSYVFEGDWCNHNTGRMQCNILGFCGSWNCRIDDFMCPRYEYNKRLIRYAGQGNCRNPGFQLNPPILLGFLVAFLSVTFLFV
jgi:hypothetical protein